MHGAAGVEPQHLAARSTRRSRWPRTRRRRTGPTACPPRRSRAPRARRAGPASTRPPGTAPPPGRGPGSRATSSCAAHRGLDRGVGVVRRARRRRRRPPGRTAPGSTDSMTAPVVTRSPSMSAGTLDRERPATASSTATPNSARAGRAPPLGDRLGPVRRGSAGSVGSGLGASVGPGSSSTVGRRRAAASSARPSAKRCRTKDSLDVFSSSRRTR